MIQEIASSSGGAIIKILADKRDTKNAEEDTVVAVIGSQPVVFDALTKIIEQIEYFKNGGPVLNSGKAIFLSIPEQFRNSIILRNGVISKLGADNPSIGDPLFDQLQSQPQNNMSSNNNNYYIPNKNQQQQNQGYQQQNRANYNIKRESPIPMRRRSRSRSRSLSKGERRKFSDERKFDKKPIRSHIRGGRDTLPRENRERRDEQFDSHERRNLRDRDTRENRDNRDRRSSRDNRDGYGRPNTGYRNERDPRDSGRNEYFRGGRDQFDNSFNNLPNNIGFNQRRESPEKRNNFERRDNRDNRDNREPRDSQRERGGYGNNNSNPIHKEPHSTISFLDNGQQKIATSIVVPDNLVSFLIGKNGDNIKNLMSKCGCLISFAKEVSFVIILKNYF